MEVFPAIFLLLFMSPAWARYPYVPEDNLNSSGPENDNPITDMPTGTTAWEPTVPSPPTEKSESNTESMTSTTSPLNSKEYSAEYNSSEEISDSPEESLEMGAGRRSMALPIKIPKLIISPDSENQTEAKPSDFKLQEAFDPENDRDAVLALGAKALKILVEPLINPQSNNEEDSQPVKRGLFQNLLTGVTAFPPTLQSPTQLFPLDTTTKQILELIIEIFVKTLVRTIVSSFLGFLFPSLV